MFVFSTVFLTVLICILTIIVLKFSLFVVDQETVAVVERLGKFNRAATAGLNFRLPFLEWVSGWLSLRIQQIDITIETKTKDNVFVKVEVSVQYHVVAEKIYDAFYRLTDPKKQIESFVFDVIRAEVPKLILDDVFEKKDSIAIAVKNELAELMSNFGYALVKALVTNIEPDEKVKAAMNEINEQQRLRMAAQEKGEAEKILIVKNAEAEAEGMRLQGLGVANQRKAIIDGLKQSIREFQAEMSEVSPSEIMNLVMMVQYYDTLKDIGSRDKSNTIFMPHSPSSVSDIAKQLLCKSVVE
ncbi:MAG: SPFH domain-containing protein [Gammaproteobacteria bacterium]|nr:SPFH domain-containing protein [Gammaproteobacteria bacterium]